MRNVVEFLKERGPKGPLSEAELKALFDAVPFWGDVAFGVTCGGVFGSDAAQKPAVLCALGLKQTPECDEKTAFVSAGLAQAGQVTVALPRIKLEQGGHYPLLLVTAVKDPAKMETVAAIFGRFADAAANGELSQELFLETERELKNLGSYFGVGASLGEPVFVAAFDPKPALLLLAAVGELLHALVLYKLSLKNGGEETLRLAHDVLLRHVQTFEQLLEALQNAHASSKAPPKGGGSFQTWH